MSGALFTSEPYRPRDTPPPMEAPLPGELGLAVKPEPPTLDVFDVGDEDGVVPPRQWLLGNTFCRSFLSGLIGAGGYGKTTMRIVQALALATGRDITGEFVFLRCRVLVVCLEDDLDELRRRVRAAMLHHRIKPADVAGRLFLTTPRGLRISQYGSDGKSVVRGGLYDALVAQIDRLNLDLVMIDPAVKAHGLDENDNAAIDAFATSLTSLAAEMNIAVDLLSHERKASGEAGDVNRGRGAGSQKDAGRLVYTLTPMRDDEAKALAVGGDERRFLARLDSAKVNIAPPSTKATWFRLVAVPLGNGTDLYPQGDVVQTFEPWAPAPIFEGTTGDDLNRALRRIGAGMPDGRRYSTSNAARGRHAWHAVKAEFPDFDEARCKAIVAKWAEADDIFEIGDYHDPTVRKDVKGIVGVRLIGEITTEE